MSEPKNKNMSMVIERAKSNDYEALKELIKSEQQKIYMTFYYLCPDCDDIADMTQDALIKICKNIKNLKNPNSFSSWMNTIVTRIFYDRMRKQSGMPQKISIEESSETCPALQICDTGRTPEEKTIHEETDKIIKEMIYKLPENFRVVTVLREIAGLSYDEIAKATGIEPGTVKSRISRSRNKLRECLEPYIDCLKG